MDEEIISRIQTVIAHYGLSVSAFADEIGVQRSSISHLLSGRNKPSLDFVMKLVNAYPEVNLYWLLKGEGGFPESTSTIAESHKTAEPEEKVAAQSADAPSPIKEVAHNPPHTIVLLFEDGTFQTYKGKKD
ncbi:XRE family transcriptional regulator [Flagellimonas taeanensis]|uniref:helix-turn-helix transcriptional regulator n=1 Tax=Flavobacteriaceae TaxID=49546 RepID=UPI000E68C2E1|nr:MULTISPECIES: helix-turn-helix transcriptional regulator [Allomuricauda]MDC6386190.1 helix-turn-helix transcriptional regulator [Muricauda sp. SK9]RIV48130.1 XRE family transcriptional regulator [Allomuricauda taeanensis]